MGVLHRKHRRMAELWSKHKNDGLTKKDYEELSECLDWNLERCENVIELENQSLFAHMTDDVEWQHAICAKIEKLKEEC